MTSSEHRDSLPQPMVVPMAYLEDEGGPRLVVWVVGTKEYAIVGPPNYDVANARRSTVGLDAAIAKHGFSRFPEDQPPTTDLKAFAVSLEKKSP